MNLMHNGPANLQSYLSLSKTRKKGTAADVQCFEVFSEIRSQGGG